MAAVAYDCVVSLSDINRIIEATRRHCLPLCERRLPLLGICGPVVWKPLSARGIGRD